MVENESRLYILDNSGEYQKIEPIKKIPKIVPGGVIKNNEKLATIGEYSKEYIPFDLRTISKKRFVKLLMGMGYQKLEALKIHNEYIHENRSRYAIQSYLFINVMKLKKEEYWR